MRRVLAVWIALCAACRPTGAPTARKQPRLVVLVVIDQWPSYMFEQQRSQVVFTGGIGRLIREGAIVPRGELPYANTFTAPGHATIGTGTTPNVHGVVGNYWYRRAEGRARPAEYDPETPVFAVGAAVGESKLTDNDNASSRVLRVEGIADALRKATGGVGRSVAIGLKSRAACLVAGKPDLAIWYEPGAGGMTTSKAYASEPPKWLIELASSSPVSRYFGSLWNPRDRSMLADATGIPDDGPGENVDHGLGATFPHAVSKSQHPEHAIMETPFGDELVSRTVAVALDAMQLGRDDVPDLLAISFGSHDYAGHRWGPDSWEVLDLTLRLDNALGQLFDTLDARLGTDGWAVILTSDHGATPIVERGRVPDARRVAFAEVEQAAQKAIAAELGDAGPWVVQLASSNLYLTQKFADQPEERRATALEAARVAMAAVPGIATAGRVDQVPADCEGQTELQRAICLALVPGEAGELYAYASAGSVITEYKAGTGHDAPFDDNRRVPIIVKAPGVKPRDGNGTLLQVAPTLAALLGVPPPAAAKEPPLFGIKKRP